MTRQEFIDEVTTWSELIDFCEDNCLGVCDDIIDGEYLDEYITEDIKDYINYERWDDLRDRLNDISSGYDYYYREGQLDYVVVDGDFESYKNDSLSAMDNYGRWDDEEDEEPLIITSTQQSDDTTPVEDEPFSVDELISASRAQISTISAEISNESAPVEVEIEAFIGVKATIKGGNQDA